MSYPDIKTFLSSCRLEEYTPKFLEMGFDDVDFLINYISSSPQQMQALVKQTNLKPGHMMKLNAAIQRYHQQFPGKLIHPQTTPDGVEDSSSSEVVDPPTGPSSVSQPVGPSVFYRQQPRGGSQVFSSSETSSSTAESQLDGQMEDLERSLTRLMDLDVDLDSEIGRAVQQECRDRSRMPSSA
eukprot:TRINITY_DN5775_c0_g1_i9.p1 TRINITY_DN5775_c0_g1~~TRINITY_DN5775_c0_g1_i9.p1  ORF type:complete len:183 (-),score=27.73 TRINITY_DN5775_c0_g1_i9:18-566(-)